MALKRTKPIKLISYTYDILTEKDPEIIAEIISDAAVIHADPGTFDSNAWADFSGHTADWAILPKTPNGHFHRIAITTRSPPSLSLSYFMHQLAFDTEGFIIDPQQGEVFRPPCIRPNLHCHYILPREHNHEQEEEMEPSL